VHTHTLVPLTLGALYTRPTNSDNHTDGMHTTGVVIGTGVATVIVAAAAAGIAIADKSTAFTPKLLDVLIVLGPLGGLYSCACIL
jgi:hypothetical protein